MKAEGRTGHYSAYAVFALGPPDVGDEIVDSPGGSFLSSLPLTLAH